MLSALFIWALGNGALALSNEVTPLWLVVGASDTSPALIATKSKALAGKYPGSLVFNTRDCGDKKAVFGWAAATANSAAEADIALARVRAEIKQAYLKRCEVRPRSLLALRFNAVDPSIADIPDSAVNWSDDDRVSSSIRLADGRALVVVRHFVKAPSDPLEGRRERLVMIEARDKQTSLVDNCVSPAAIAVRKERLILQCVRGQAADELLHSTLVFDADARLIVEIEHCRDPSWIGDTAISCADESVDAQGRLKLSAKRTPLPVDVGGKP